MEAFDSTFLTLLFVPNAQCSIDRGRERVDFLIADINGRGDRIVIPTPVLAEVLIGVGHSRSQILNELTKSQKFLIAPFDVRAALELSLIAEGLTKPRMRGKKGTRASTRAKVAFDRQILAVAKVYGVKTMYTEDEDMGKIARKIGMKVITVADLPLPYQVPTGTGLFDNLKTDAEMKQEQHGKASERKTDPESS